MPVLEIHEALKLPTCRDWPADRLCETFRERAGMTFEDLLTSGIAPTDLLWLLMREPWLNDEQLEDLASEFVSMILSLSVDLDALDLAQEAAGGNVSEAHVRHPEDDDVWVFWANATPGMMAAHYAALWSALAVAKWSGREAGEKIRARQLEMTVQQIREVHDG